MERNLANPLIDCIYNIYTHITPNFWWEIQLITQKHNNKTPTSSGKKYLPGFSKKKNTQNNTRRLAAKKEQGNDGSILPRNNADQPNPKAVEVVVLLMVQKSS